MKYFYCQINEPPDSPFNELSESTFAYSDLLLFTSPLRILWSGSKLFSRINLNHDCKSMTATFFAFCSKIYQNAINIPFLPPNVYVNILLKSIIFCIIMGTTFEYCRNGVYLFIPLKSVYVANWRRYCVVFQKQVKKYEHELCSLRDEIASFKARIEEMITSLVKDLNASCHILGANVDFQVCIR